MISKETLGLLSLACATIGPVTYLWSVYKGRTRPHIFSWTVWGIIMGIVFFAQSTHEAGPGAWVTGFSMVVQFVVAGAALRRGEKNITKSDWVAFVSALAIIPFWYFTKSSLWAVILATAIDLLAYYPTFRKSFVNPYQESYYIYALDGLKWIPALFALTNYSFVTMLYPICILLTNASVAVMIIWRRNLTSPPPII